MALLLPWGPMVLSPWGHHGTILSMLGLDSALGHSSTLRSTTQALFAIFLFLPLVFLCSFPLHSSLLFSVSISLSLSSTRKALLYFLVTLIDCINLSAYWISPAPCREHCAICL